MSNKKPNTRPVTEFISIIEDELRSQNASWSKIGDALAEADSQYGTDSDAYKKILRKTNISPAKARKLVCISRSPRFKQHEDVFGTVHSWTTLYEVTTLDDDQFAELIETASDPLAIDKKGHSVVTASLVSKIKRGNTPVPTDPYKSIFDIRLDENALKAGEFEGEDYERLMNLVREIQDTVPFIRVDATERVEKQEASYWKKIEKEAKKVRRQTLEDAIKTYKKNDPTWKKWKTMTQKEKKRAISTSDSSSIYTSSGPWIAAWSDKEELLNEFRENPEEVFASLDCDLYSNNAVYTTAANNLAEKSAAFLAKANERFLYAGKFDDVTPDEDTSVSDDDKFAEKHDLSSDERKEIMEAMLSVDASSYEQEAA